MPSPRTRHRAAAPESRGLRQLGERVRRARTEAGLSQAQLGTPYYTRAHVSAIELGKIRPAVRSLEHIAARLGKPLSYFVEDESLERERAERAVSLGRARQLTAEGRAQEAIALLVPLLEREQTSLERAVVLRAIGRAYWEAGFGSRSASVLEEALEIFRRAGDREQETRTRAQLGMALHLLMSYGEAAEHLGEALRAIARGEVRDPLFKVHVLHNLGLTHYQRNQFPVALEYFERAESEGADIGDPKWLASLFAAIGMSRYELRDYDVALRYLSQSEALFESIRNRSRAAQIRFLRGKSLLAIGHRSTGLSLLVEAQRLAEQAGNRVLSVRIRANWAVALAEDGERDEAVRVLRETVAEADELGELPLRFATRLALARAVKEHDVGEAERALREVADFLARTPGPELGEAYAELSDVLSRRGLSEEALDYARRALELSAARSSANRGGGAEA